MTAWHPCRRLFRELAAKRRALRARRAELIRRIRELERQPER